MFQSVVFLNLGKSIFSHFIANKCISQQIKKKREEKITIKIEWMHFFFLFLLYSLVKMMTLFLHSILWKPSTRLFCFSILNEKQKWAINLFHNVIINSSMVDISSYPTTKHCYITMIIIIVVVLITFKRIDVILWMM